MSEFSLSRSTTVDASPTAVHALIDDFHQWTRWSPWEDVDPDLQRTHTGPPGGVGATYEWSGNSKAGQGRMEIIESTADKVVVDLRFLKPFKATNTTTFDLARRDRGTEVTWTMTGRRNPVMSLAGRLFFDKAIGKDFDKGLARLKAAAKQPSP